ncbi:alpha-N-acetylglucosaminidase-like [Styela clava]
MQTMYVNLVLISILISTTFGNDVKLLDPLVHLHNVKSYTTVGEQTTAVQELLKRIIGDRSKDFQVDVNLTTSSGNDIVIITNPSVGKIKISGTSGVAVAFGFNHYLKYYCNKSITWAEDNLFDLPDPLPSLKSGKLELNAGVKYRYYQNVCTVSYSSVWWNWTRWEREIDWMALNGVNLPLAFTGQEAIWRRVYKQFGCTDQDLANHFAGPAFLAWGRMGNVDGWGGPLPTSWIENQLALQHKILTRMRSIGIIPVLPGFAGHIPEAITKLYKVNATRLSSWSHFNCTYSCTYLLEPTDPLFLKIGKMFIEEQIKEYNGTNHIYNADMFNEMTPRSSDTTYLSETSAAVFNAMKATDKDAIWLMQGWLFRNTAFWKPDQEKALLTGVPLGKMIVLDLFSESSPEYAPTHSYYGQPFIWCMLHNFGGNTGFYGKIDTINKGPAAALSFMNSTMIGTGLTPEGINQNYIIYDLMLEVGYFIIPRNITDWVNRFVVRRYASDNLHLQHAWSQLAATIYNDTTPGYPTKRTIRGPIVDRPTTNLPEFPRWYDQKSLLTIWDEFMMGLEDVAPIPTVKYDAVDITRQMLQYYHFDAQYALITAFNNKDEAGVNHAAHILLDVIDYMDEILTTEQHFLMGKWVEDARNMGTNDAEKDLYEYNARNQVTLWGPAGEIHDYASKEWGSLMKYYYKPRWSLFVDRVKECVRTGSHFNHGKFSQDVFNQVEQPFTMDQTLMPYDPIGNPIAVAQKIYKIYRGQGFLNNKPK